MTVVQGVEGVKELLLRAFLAAKKLDIVDHQDIRVAVFLAEFHQCAVLDGIDELVGKLLAGKVNDARGFLVVDDVVADGLQQVRLAQAASAVNEKGIVGLGGRLGDAPWRLRARTGCSIRRRRSRTCSADSSRTMFDSGRAREAAARGGAGLASATAMAETRPRLSAPGAINWIFRGLLSTSEAASWTRRR